MMNGNVIKIVNSYITLKFFEEEVLHKSWYYLLVNDLITYEGLKENLLKLTFDENSGTVF